MKGLTSQQRQVLQIIGTRLLRDDQPPTMREIARELGVSSTCTVHRHVEALARKAFVARTERYAYRSITLTEAGWRELRLGTCPGCEQPASAPVVPDARGQAWHRDCAGKALAELLQAA